MAIDLVTLTADEARRVLALTEDHFNEGKSKRVSPSKLSRLISAFANADGGELTVGLEEQSGTFAWDGFADIEDANAHLAVFEELFPLGQGFDYAFFQTSGLPGLLLRVSVQKSPAVRRASDGIPYLRRGAQSLPYGSPEQVRQLERNKGITSFETEVVGVGLETITNSETIIGFMLQVVPTGEPERWLRKQNLIRDEKPTVAGLLLFSDEPQSALPKRCAIKVYRYKTSDAAGTRETLASDPMTVEGSLYDQIKSAEGAIIELIQEIKVLGSTGFESVQYPPETLHEILTNAIIHRDYSLADDVHVRIFDNRVEVESPGRLPAHVTVENILHERFARNGNIVRLINKFPDPPNKDVGEGLNTAFAAMKQLHLKEPQIQELDNSVVVNIRHERLASPEELVMDYIRDHDRITNSVGRELTNIGSENKMKRVFERLMEAGQIERIPDLKGRAAAYRKPERP